MSGINPDWGKKQVIGMEMALEKVNRRGGVNGAPVEAVVYDSGGDPKQALALYHKLGNEDKVLAVIGPVFSHECEAIFPVTNEVKLVVIATASATPPLKSPEPWA